MGDTAALVLRRVGRVTVSLLPWAAVLYLHYWLEHAGIWAVDMPFRAAISIVLLALGMGLSFLLYSWLARRGGR
jgi:hypothetical protein